MFVGVGMAAGDLLLGTESVVKSPHHSPMCITNVLTVLRLLLLPPLLLPLDHPIIPCSGAVPVWLPGRLPGRRQRGQGRHARRHWRLAGPGGGVRDWQGAFGGGRSLSSGAAGWEGSAPPRAACAVMRGEHGGSSIAPATPCYALPCLYTSLYRDIVRLLFLLLCTTCAHERSAACGCTPWASAVPAPGRMVTDQ